MAHNLPSAANPAEVSFVEDPRAFFNKETGTWRLEDDDGAEFEYDQAKSIWVSLLDEELVKSQQAVYSVAGVDEETPAAPILAREKRKRKQQDYDPSQSAVASIKRGKASSSNTSTSSSSSKDKPPPKPKNTAVYVTNLPLDAELDEIHDRFAKCGVIEEDDAGDPKIKMYARDDGSFSGEALVVFFKEDSVTLAVSLMDDAELRLGQAATRMHVQKAQFSHKNSGGGNGDGTNGEPSAPRRTVNKKKATKRLGKMQRKLEDWDSEDEFGPSMAPTDKMNRAANKNNRVVVLKHMFTLKELEEDASLLLDLKEDVRDECSTLGEVTNVVLYDKEPAGIMTVKFREPLSAQACIIKMQGRFFAGRRVEAFLYSGKERYNRTVGGADYTEMEVDDESEKKRLEDFANWLMMEGD